MGADPTGVLRSILTSAHTVWISISDGYCGVMGGVLVIEASICVESQV